MVEGMTVTGTNKIEQMTPGGSFETVYRVTYKTDLGATGVLMVPERRWTAEALPAILEKERDKVDMALALGLPD